MTTLAKQLGIPEHHSLLLDKAAALGLPDAGHLIALAVLRGCAHYGGGPEELSATPPSREVFSDAELAIALLSPCLPYGSRAIRVGAQMLGCVHNHPGPLALLARKERAEAVVQHIASAGQATEPEEKFWPELLAALSPDSRRGQVPVGVLPHQSRFRLESGVAGPSGMVDGGGRWVRWLRPSPVA